MVFNRLYKDKSHIICPQILDADKQRLESTRGRVSVRDIVQFVPFRDVQGRLF